MWDERDNCEEEGRSREMFTDFLEGSKLGDIDWLIRCLVKWQRLGIIVNIGSLRSAKVSFSGQARSESFLHIWKNAYVDRVYNKHSASFLETYICTLILKNGHICHSSPSIHSRQKLTWPFLSILLAFSVWQYIKFIKSIVKWNT